MGGDGAGDAGPLSAFRSFFALERDVLVLSLAMFAFSLAFQMTTRFLPEYIRVLGGSGFVVGLFLSVGNVIAASYPYPGGAISDRIGSRYALTLFGALSTLGFGFWLVAPAVGEIEIGGLVVEPWVWIFVGLLLAQAWKSFGLGATFAVVKQATDPSRLAAGFASTETVRRVAFLVGPLTAAALLGLQPAFEISFQSVLALAVGFGVLGTVVQHRLYEAGADEIGPTLAGLNRIRRDLRQMPAPLRPLLVGDTVVRFANGMVYGFFILVVTEVYAVGVDVSTSVAGVPIAFQLGPGAFFGVLLGVEMLVALLVMAPAAKVAESVGLKPVVALGFAVYAVFPLILIGVPGTAGALVLAFAFSGLRFAGLPSHKALIVGPAEHGAGGRVTGTYYLLRNAIVIPSGALGGSLWEFGSPEVAFTIAALIGALGTGYFVVFGEEFAAYA